MKKKELFKDLSDKQAEKVVGGSGIGRDFVGRGLGLATHAGIGLGSFFTPGNSSILVRVPGFRDR